MDHEWVLSKNPAVMSPTLLEDEGRLWLFFNIGPRLHNEIGLAMEQE
jgi:hypothetical protein